MGLRRFFGDSATRGLLDCLRGAPIEIVLQHENLPGVRDPGETRRHKEYHSAGELGERFCKESSSIPDPQPLTPGANLYRRGHRLPYLKFQLGISKPRTPSASTESKVPADPVSMSTFLITTSAPR